MGHLGHLWREYSETVGETPIETDHADSELLHASRSLDVSESQRGQTLAASLLVTV